MDELPKSELPAGAAAVLVVGANRPSGLDAAVVLKAPKVFAVVVAGAGLNREPADVVAVAGLPRSKREEPPVAGRTLVPCPKRPPFAGAAVVAFWPNVDCVVVAPEPRVRPNMLPGEAEEALAVDGPKRDGVAGLEELVPNIPAADRASVVELGSKILLRFAAGSVGTVVSRFKLPMRLLLPTLPLPRVPAGDLLGVLKKDILRKTRGIVSSRRWHGKQALTTCAGVTAVHCQSTTILPLTFGAPRCKSRVNCSRDVFPWH